MWRDSFVWVTWLIRLCNVTYSNVFHTCDVTRVYALNLNNRGQQRGAANAITHWYAHFDTYLWHDSSISMTWLIHIYDMTHQYLWHDSSISMTWLIHDMYVQQDDNLLICATCWCVQQDAWCMTWLIATCWYVQQDATLVDLCNLLMCATRHACNLLMCATRREIYDMTHSSYVWLTRFSHACNMTHDLWHDSLIRPTWLMYRH